MPDTLSARLPSRELDCGNEVREGQAEEDVTLIITVASPHAIFQSSDFRITKSGKPLSDREPKRVAFQAHESYAQVACSGIAELGGQMLGDWLAGEIGALEIWTMRLDEVVKVVQGRLDAALHTASLDGRLALVFAAFEKGTPRLIWCRISTHLGDHGYLHARHAGRAGRFAAIGCQIGCQLESSCHRS